MSNSIKGAEDLTWLTSQSGRGARFGQVNPVEDERLHEVGPNADPASTETYWFVLSDPKSKFVAHFYVVMRQKFAACGASSYIYRGFPASTLQMNHYNLHTSIPRPKFEQNKLCVPQLGMTIEVIEPMQRWRVLYNPPDGGAEADLEFEARMPAAKTPNNEHFDQAVWCKGRLRCEDETVSIDAPGFRDRTWNAPRPEVSIKHPPLAYLWGALGDGRTAFCFRGGDDPSRGVEWKGAYELTNEQLFHGGWIHIDGKLLAVTGMSKRTARDPTNKMRPTSVEVDFEDETGAKHHLTGTPSAAMGFSPWGNIFAWMNGMDWVLDGKLHGRGEIQEAVWRDYAKRFWK